MTKNHNVDKLKKKSLTKNQKSKKLTENSIYRKIEDKTLKNQKKY